MDIEHFNLETERLILRKFTSQDAQALLSILGDQEVNTFLPMFPLKTIEEAKTCLQQYLDDYDRGDGYRYAVCLKKDNIPIGYVHVSGEKSHDFGYGLKKEFWHRGIITEASQAVVDQLRRDGLPYITATHDVNNPRSGEVMKRIGMKYQYSYKEQWQPKNILVTFRMYQLNLDGNEGRIYWEYWERYPVHFVESGL
ncbi:MAG TPA: GNAT family N-acetyltransferase [Firmicutes bacterium]|nr:GNAT family N-acetyltransferase [Bacillota bacterium]